MMSPRCLRRALLMTMAAAPFCVNLAIEARIQQPPPTPTRTQTQSQSQAGDFFETKVRPVLASNCYDCHTDQHMGGLRVDSRDALLKGGRSGPAIVPGDADKSPLIQAIRQTSEKLKMPKGGHLRPEEIDALAEWVKAGAQWPSSANASTSRESAFATAAKPA